MKHERVGMAIGQMVLAAPSTWLHEVWVDDDCEGHVERYLVEGWAAFQEMTLDCGGRVLTVGQECEKCGHLPRFGEIEWRPLVVRRDDDQCALDAIDSDGENVAFIAITHGDDSVPSDGEITTATVLAIARMERAKVERARRAAELQLTKKL